MKKKHLVNFKEYVDSETETSNYEIPYAAVIPPEDDKIWHYMRNQLDKAPLWGTDMNQQEEDNKVLGDRDGEI